MRSFLLVIALGTLGACSAPGSWDNLAGGTTPDPTLTAPRLVSPLTVTTVSTLRPKLKWALDGGATGAIVEMSKTRAFDGDIKTFDAKGARELVIPEDLDAGIWFWRVRGRTDAKTGTIPSNVWEVLVRGPAANGASDIPTGSVFDIDGDGEPDLTMSADWSDSSLAPGSFPMAMLARGKAGGDVQMDMNNFYQLYDNGPSSLTVVLAGGIDFDGDGFADVVQGVDLPPIAGVAQPPSVIVSMGDPKGISFDRYVAIQEPWTKVPNVYAAGDINGDGYGDLLYGAINGASVGFGSSAGPISLVTSYELAPDSVVPDTKPRAILAGFDANGDGLADFVMAPVLAKGAGSGVNHSGNSNPTGVPTIDDGTSTAGGGNAIPLRYTPGSQDVLARLAGEELKVNNNQSQVSRAAAFATGDFNGDAIPDIASTVDANGVREVCVWFGDRAAKLVAGPCVVAGQGDVDFGASLTSADLDASGKDILLITSSAGVRAAKLDNGALTADTVVAPGYGTTLSTIWPGRPGKARWAAVSADGSEIGIFEGIDKKTAIHKPTEVVGNFGRAMR